MSLDALNAVYNYSSFDDGEHERFAYDPPPFDAALGERAFDASADDLFVRAICVRHGIGCEANGFDAIEQMTRCSHPSARHLVRIWKGLDGLAPP